MTTPSSASWWTSFDCSGQRIASAGPDDGRGGLQEQERLRRGPRCRAPSRERGSSARRRRPSRARPGARSVDVRERDRRPLRQAARPRRRGERPDRVALDERRSARRPAARNRHVLIALPRARARPPCRRGRRASRAASCAARTAPRANCSRRGRAVGELEPLALSAEVDRVLADHVAAAERLDADLPGGPLAEDAVAAEGESARGVAPERLRGDLAEPHGGAGRRVLLLLVVKSRRSRRRRRRRAPAPPRGRARRARSRPRSCWARGRSGSVRAAAATRAFASGVKPVEPITRATPRSAQSRRAAPRPRGS